MDNMYQFEDKEIIEIDELSNLTKLELTSAEPGDFIDNFGKYFYGYINHPISKKNICNIY